MSAPGLAHVGVIFDVTWSTVTNVADLQWRDGDDGTGAADGDGDLPVCGTGLCRFGLFGVGQCAAHDTGGEQHGSRAGLGEQRAVIRRATAWALAAWMLWLIAAPAFATDTVYYYLSDTLHSEVVVTDQNRNVVEQTDYAPYGQVLNRALRDGPGYTGHEEDPETGLVYMQQRYYDAQSGLFLSTDPVLPTSGGGNFNRYWYANDNPYRYTDPFGEAPTQPIAAPGSCNAGSGCARGGDQVVPQEADQQEAKQIGPDGSLESRSPGLAAFISGLSTTASAFMENAEAVGPQKALGVLGPIGVGIELLVVPGPMGAAPCEMSSTPCGMMSKTPDVPSVGPPGQWVNGKRRSRLYGTDGRPKVDIDNPHQGADYPHVHEWDENGVREHPGREVPNLPPPEPESSS